MKTVYYPYSYDGNKYAKIIIESINEAGFEVYPFKGIFFKKNIFNDVKIFNLNWFENIQASNNVKVFLKFLIRIIQLKYLKFKNKKIIWTMHNKAPHELKNNKLVNILMKSIAKSSDKIVILSEETILELKGLISKNEIEKKVVKIQHPNYIGEYPIPILKKNKSNNLKILFLGMIRPYKNVELILDIAKEFEDKNIDFIIAGKPINKEYENILINSIKSNNVKTIFKFINDNEMINLINESDLLLLPYDLKSSLNSGSILLAFSNKKTVISPLIGTLKEFKNKKIFFSYEYRDAYEHKERLIKELNKVYKMSKDQIRIMGEMCYEYVEENNSKAVIRNKYKNLYNELIDY
ncbi:glycosyltransferase [Clostridium perfringens]|nr:glycosyltransferase [Clostridium perfringens]